MEDKINDALVYMIPLVILGGYFLVNSDNPFSREMGRRKGYNPDKVSYMLGFGCLGLAAACIPWILGIIFPNVLLDILPIIIVILVLVAVHIYETSGRLK